MSVKTKTTTKRASARSSAKAKKAKKLPVCTAKDLRKKKSKRRKCRVVKKKPVLKATALRPSPTGPVAAPPAAAPTPDAFPTAPTVPAASGLLTYDGPFGVAEAQRLLFRAGFGPTPGQAAALAALGLRGAVDRLLNPGPAQLSGPAPTGTFLVGGQFAPADRYGHIHLQLLDRQIRSTDQLGERMTLILHDWFAVSQAAADKRLVVDHLQLLRDGWRGSFRTLLSKVTIDPAMLMFLDGIGNQKKAPNENYGREVMELYALGADRGAYTEADVKEMARSLTGWRADWTDGIGFNNFRYDAARHDTGNKTIFAGTSYAKTGNLGWQDAINAVVDHPMHPSFVVRKLWSYFVPTEPAADTQAQLEALYRSSGEQLLPLVQAILVHPDLYRGASMVKPPVVFAAGLLRGAGQGITTDAWVWRCDGAGQLLGAPPNVAGWNDRAWLNTSSHAARWGMVQETLRAFVVQGAAYRGKTETADAALASALGFWGNPALETDHLATMQRIANQTWKPGVSGDYGSSENFLANRQNVLRQAIPATPDFQVS